MFIPRDMLQDVATQFPHEMCAAYRIVLHCDLLLSVIYLGFVLNLPPLPEGEAKSFSYFLWLWMWQPLLFSIPGALTSFRALKFYENVRFVDHSKTTEYILNANRDKMVNYTWWLRRIFVAWNTVTLIFLMRPHVRNDQFLSACWALSVLCAFWTALEKILFAVFFNCLSRSSLWTLRYRISRMAPKWRLNLSSDDVVASECLVCHSTLESGAQVRRIPCLCHRSGGRVYHADCIDQWLRAIHDFCPVCSHKLFEKKDGNCLLDVSGD